MNARKNDHGCDLSVFPKTVALSDGSQGFNVYILDEFGERIDLHAKDERSALALVKILEDAIREHTVDELGIF
jgi:hypothetical protein